MIVLRTLANGVWSHAGVRFTEWLGAVPLVGLGYVLYAEPDALASSPSFSALSSWADAGTWSNIILSVGILRLIALFINGSFKSFQHSPKIRFLASCVASFFWMLFAVGVFLAWRDSGGAPTGPVVYSTLLLLEFRNAYVSRVDMAVTRGLSHARTKR